MRASKGFFPETDEITMGQERRKARELRQSQWWKRQVARSRCFYCGRSVSPRDLTMDHIVPLVRGGKSSKGNIVPACKECNNKKKHMLPMEWDAYMAKLNENSIQ
jgi:5-methylcytosine-specific restriction endonuclease McrA